MAAGESTGNDLLECGCRGEYRYGTQVLSSLYLNFCDTETPIQSNQSLTRYNNQALSAVSDPSDVPDPSAVSDPTAVSDPSPYYTVDSKKSQLLELMRWSHSHQVWLLLHCYCIVIVLLLHCYYTVITLLLHCYYTVITLLYHSYCTVISLDTSCHA